jgi:thymidylate kinase
VSLNDSLMTDHVGRIVTFSGIDGAGKSTQIESLSKSLSEQGFRVLRVTFWDDVAFLSRFRASISLRTLGNKRSSDHSPLLRNDKNVHTWYLTLVRSIFYLFDCLRLRRAALQLRKTNSDFVIFDRYIYDQIVQIRARHWLARAYVRLLAAIAPRPDAGFILDASPDDAFGRKPEYPLAFMHEYRRAFLALTRLVPELIVIAPGSIAEVQQQIVAHLPHNAASSTKNAALKSGPRTPALSNSR